MKGFKFKFYVEKKKEESLEKAGGFVGIHMAWRIVS